LFKRNEKKNRKGTLTPKMPIAAGFSCCVTIDFNQCKNTFRGGYGDKCICKSSEFILLLTCKKIAEVIFVSTKREEKSQRYSNTKMPFAARFSCCATIDFNSILKYFPRGYHNKFYIKVFGMFPAIDL